MKKIISLFQRNYDGDRQVRNEVVPGAEWVLAGEGIATRKYDGACLMIRDGIAYKRYDAKPGRTPPKDFEPAQPYDSITGHQPGWVPVGNGPEDQWFRAALDGTSLRDNGTYEVCGPHFNGNPEHFLIDGLVTHGCEILPEAPRNFEDIKTWLATQDIEGIVWHRSDGRMVKIKKKDFGLKRAIQLKTPEI